MNRWDWTTIIGVVVLVSGLALWSIPLAVVVLGVLITILGLAGAKWAS